MNGAEILSARLKEKALSEGFDLFGISAYRPLTEHVPVLTGWCSSGMNADMNYLGRDIEKRTDPGLFFPGARSVIVTGLNYYTKRKQHGSGVPLISRYSYGKDYHTVIIEKLNSLISCLRSDSPGAKAKPFVDAAPVLEKAWAREAGLGWPGRHSVIINEKIGSFFFIGVIITDQVLGYDKPYLTDRCGSCRLCLEVCPTGAINGNRTIDARKCIAYQTIESKQPLDEEMTRLARGRIFGCDICQDVCPWNKGAPENHVPEFVPASEMISLTREEWENMSEERFKKLFGHTPAGRKKYSTFMKNVTNVTNSNACE